MTPDLWAVSIALPLIFIAAAARALIERNRD